MEYVIKCTQEEKEIIQIALYGYLNRYRERLKELDGTFYETMIKDRIKVTEKMLDDIGQ